jgi:hypothetical protein
VNTLITARAADSGTACAVCRIGVDVVENGGALTEA